MTILVYKTLFFASFINFAVTTLVILPFVIRRQKNLIPAIKGSYGWFLLIAPFAALSTFAGLFAFSLTNVGYVTAIFRLSTLLTILWGWLFFKEKHIKERLLGAAVMILGTLLLVL